MEISDLIKSARIEKGLTQQQLADVVFVTRQTISKWELGKSVPDQASLILLYQYLDIKDNEKKQLSKLIFNKQNIILTINEQISNFAQTYPTNLKASSNEALLFMRRYRFANCSCFSCCFKDAYPSSNVQ